MNPLGLTLTTVLSILILALPRAWAPCMLIIGALSMTVGQMVLIGPFHFTAIRVLLFFGIIRILIRKERPSTSLNYIDKWFIAWVATNAIMFIICRASFAAFVNRLGFAYNALGYYFFFRCTVWNIEEINRLIRTAAIMASIVAIGMFIEKITQRSIYAIFGGIYDNIGTESWVRNGRVRCQGPFTISILAGSFGATLFPLMMGQFNLKGMRRNVAILGFISSIAITILSASSGPMMCLASVIIGFSCWFIKDKMRIVRWCILIGLIFAALLMHAPVWYLIYKVGVFSGGDSWHRAHIINQAFVHLNEWWLCGTAQTGHWMPYTLPDGQSDITSAYLANGVEGGIAAMFFFIMIIVQCFKAIGRSTLIAQDLKKKFFIWCLGCALIGHTINFISVSYFDQIIIFWYLLLAFISLISAYQTGNESETTIDAYAEENEPLHISKQVLYDHHK
jgi:hypothetical protein